MPTVSERRAEAPRFKQLDSGEQRRGREETSISLRKDKRKDEVNKKRFGASGPPQTAMPEAGMPTVGSQAWAEANPQALVDGVHSDDR